MDDTLYLEVINLLYNGCFLWEIMQCYILWQGYLEIYKIWLTSSRPPLHTIDLIRILDCAIKVLLKFGKGLPPCYLIIFKLILGQVRLIKFLAQFHIGKVHLFVYYQN